MLDGLTIMNTELVKVLGFGWTHLTVLFAILAIIFFILTITFISSVDNDSSYLFGAIAIVAIIAMFISGYNKTLKKEYYIYKVYIDESVSMKEFTDKYKILSREGEIWEIQEWSSSKDGRPNEELFYAKEQ